MSVPFVEFILMALLAAALFAGFDAAAAFLAGTYIAFVLPMIARRIRGPR